MSFNTKFVQKIIKIIVKLDIFTLMIKIIMILQKTQKVIKQKPMKHQSFVIQN